MCVVTEKTVNVIIRKSLYKKPFFVVNAKMVTFCFCVVPAAIDDLMFWGDRKSTRLNSSHL